MSSRTLKASTSGPVRFSAKGDFNAIKVKVGSYSHAEVVLSTQDEPGGPAHDVIESARLVGSGDSVKLTMPDLPGSGGTTITHGRGGVTVVQSAGTVYGSMTGVTIGGNVAGGDIVVNGVRLTPELLKAAGVPVSTGIDLELRLPTGSSLRVNAGNSGACNVDIQGQELDEVSLKGHNGTFYVYVPCELLEVDAHNAAILAAEPVKQIDLETHNGEIEVRRLHGSGRANVHNGSITIECHAPGKVKARSHNGTIGVHDRANLGDRLRVDVDTHNGRIIGRRS